MLKVGEVAYLCADEKDSVEREKQMVTETFISVATSWFTPFIISLAQCLPVGLESNGICF